jgi:hypothetical protein
MTSSPSIVAARAWRHTGPRRAPVSAEVVHGRSLGSGCTALESLSHSGPLRDRAPDGAPCWPVAFGSTTAFAAQDSSTSWVRRAQSEAERTSATTPEVGPIGYDCLHSRGERDLRSWPPLTSGAWRRLRVRTLQNSGVKVVRDLVVRLVA